MTMLTRFTVLFVVSLVTLAAGSCSEVGSGSLPASPSATPESDGPPRCLVDNVEDAARLDPIPGPVVSPTRGGPGTSVTISGTGFEPDGGVMVIAFFDSDDCALPGDGRGDHLLAFGTTGATGSYEIMVRWPEMFDPVEGRSLPAGGVPLPAGTYWMITVPCPSLDRSCFQDFDAGSQIGGPFTLTLR